MADMAICNDWCVEVAIALYDKCSQLDRVIFLQLESRGQFGYYSWGFQETQFFLLGLKYTNFFLLGTNVWVPLMTVFNKL